MKKLSSRSRALRKYWREVKDIQKRFNLRSITSARNKYKTVLKISSTRFERLAYDPKARPRKITAKASKKFGKIFARGKDAGKEVIYYDTLKKRVVNAKNAIKLRREFAIERLAIQMRETSTTVQRYLVNKYWPKYAKKRGYLTEIEARRVAKKVIRVKYKDHKTRLNLKNIFGYD